jgi:hypothetical protein
VASGDPPIGADKASPRAFLEDARGGNEETFTVLKRDVDTMFDEIPVFFKPLEHEYLKRLPTQGGRISPELGRGVAGLPPTGPGCSPCPGGEVGDGDKKSLSSGFLKKALFTEEPSDPML